MAGITSLKPKGKNNNPDKKKVPFYKSSFFWMAFGLLVVTFLCFLPVLSNDFVDYDDKKFIYGNYMIRDLSWDRLVMLFEHSFRTPWYKPLVYLSWAVEYKFWGYNPTVYHLNNLILHLLNSLLVLLIMRRILNNLYPAFKYNDWISLLIAALFSLSPLKVESVAWATERKDVLFSLFYLGSIIFYLKYIDLRKKRYVVYSSLIFILALLSKSMSITLPFMLFTFDYLYKRKLKLNLITEKIPYFIILLLGLYIYGVLIPKPKEDVTEYAAGPGTVGLDFQPQKENFNSTAGFYMHKILLSSYRMDKWMARTVVPVNLSVVHALPQLYFDRPNQLKSYVYPLILLILFAIGIYLHFRKKNRVWLFGTGFFFFSMLPVLQMRIYESYLSDRYTYIPSVGLFLMIGVGALLLIKYYPRIKYIVAGFMIAYLGFYAVTTFERTKVWEDSITLFTDVTEKYPDLYFGYSSLGNSYLETGNTRQAIINYNHSLQLKEYQPLIYNARGLARHNIRDFEGAMADFNRALELEPRLSKAWNNRGNTYLMKAEFKKALNDFNMAIKVDPYYAVAYNGRGMAYYNLGELQKSIEDFNRCLQLNPSYYLAYANRANSLAMMGRFEEAITDFNRSLKINPNHILAYHGRGFAKMNLNDFQGALEDFNITINKNPNHAIAYYNRGVVWFKLNNMGNACSDWNQSLKLGYRNANDYLSQYCN